MAYALAMTLGRGHFGALNAEHLLLAAAAGGGCSCGSRRGRRRRCCSRPCCGGRTCAWPPTRWCRRSSLATFVVGLCLTQALGLGAAAVGLVMSAGLVVSAVCGAAGGPLMLRCGPCRSRRIGRRCPGRGTGGRASHAGRGRLRRADRAADGRLCLVSRPPAIPASWHRRRAARPGGGHAQPVAQSWPGDKGVGAGGAVCQGVGVTDLAAAAAAAVWRGA